MEDLCIFLSPSHFSQYFLRLHLPIRAILLYYPRLTRTHTVLTGRKALIHSQRPCKYTKYSLRSFRRLAAFLPRQNCFAPDSDEFSSDFWLLRRRCVVTRQGEKGKKCRKVALSGLCALVNRGYYFIEHTSFLSGCGCGNFILKDFLLMLYFYFLTSKMLGVAHPFGWLPQHLL